MTRLATFGISLAILVAVSVVPWVRLLTERPAPDRRYETLILGSALDHIAVIGDSYTAGSAEGGRGAKGWTERAWQTLARRGVHVAAEVASEGGAGYGIPGDRGSVFADLAVRSVHPDDVLVVFFGSRNDRDVDPEQLTRMTHDTLAFTRRVAPAARLLVIGPPWPTADVPDAVLRVRDILDRQAHAVGAEFVDPIAERWFVGRPELVGADGVHPTDVGHAYMADKIVPLIGGQLPKLA